MSLREWQGKYERMSAIADRIYAMRRERIAKECEAAGLPAMSNILHNCAIAPVGCGWAAGPDGETRRKAAKRILRLWDDWTPSRIIDRWSKRVGIPN